MENGFAVRVDIHSFVFLADILELMWGVKLWRIGYVEFEDVLADRNLVRVALEVAKAYFARSSYFVYHRPIRSRRAVRGSDCCSCPCPDIFAQNQTKIKRTA